MPNNLENIYNQLQDYNPQANNYWSNFAYPFSPTQKLGALDKYANLAGSNVRRLGASNVARATGGAGKRAMAAGYGGSIGQDLISGAGEAAGADTTNALTNVELGRLSEVPGIMNTSNLEAFNVTGQKQNVDFENIANMLKKFGMSSDMANTLDTRPGLLADIFAGVNTGSNLFKAFFPKGF